jgi:hypothetical protein
MNTDLKIRVIRVHPWLISHTSSVCTIGALPAVPRACIPPTPEVA